jgi:hypothetical protein
MFVCSKITINQRKIRKSQFYKSHFAMVEMKVG